MLDRVDRMQLAVRDRAAAAAVFASVLGAKKIREDTLGPPLNCQRAIVQAGDSEFELLEPAGDGLVADHLAQWGEGIFGVGFSSNDLDDVANSLERARVKHREQGSEVSIDPDQTHGMRTVLRATEKRDKVGLITGLYEVTNIVANHEEAARFYTAAFGLDATRFSPIKSDTFGYIGTLTLYDPPAKLDRIEITQTNDDTKAMGRFFNKRGPSVYMCFTETPDIARLRANLDAIGARYAGAPEGPGSLFIHPTTLCGMLMGVSETNEAWLWSGRPELVPVRN